MVSCKESNKAKANKTYSKERGKKELVRESKSKSSTILLASCQERDKVKANKAHSKEKWEKDSSG